ncbi:hypothetical protein GDO86_013739 [Hymenochirus boettgeri]|uniref:Uncharacterized protein n=1 Tax=Hymenochirus boettgeri TaxID=247094 RepID=A0A8T2JRH6_9PIPI|nr:hypothetical protein GDO86_013739 [Hymenochirus boettgeri]KAG8445977.1 hypothetical protein GDO86_013739 [Hymenochirus boettgeri]
MAKEDPSVSEIKLLQSERLDRIWRLTNIVVELSQKDNKVLMKRWAPGELNHPSYSERVSAFDLPSNLTVNIGESGKFSDLTISADTDDSVCTELSDFDGPSDGIETEVARRENTSLDQSVIDFEGPMSESELQGPSFDEKCLQISRDKCRERNKMLELRILDLEEYIENHKELTNPIRHTKSYVQDIGKLMRLCEVFRAETRSALKELAILRDRYDCVLLENERLKHSLQERTNELKTQQEYESEKAAPERTCVRRRNIPISR